MITDKTALLYCSNKMKMIQRMDALNKPRSSPQFDTLIANLRMQEEEKAVRNRSKFKP